LLCTSDLSQHLVWQLDINVSWSPAASIFWAEVKMEAIYYSETLVAQPYTAVCHNPEDNIVYK